MTERWTRERRMEQTRTVLLDAAETIFASRGYAGSLEDIADAAGYTRGAIYAQFGGKDALFLAVIERHRQRFLDGFADVMASFDRFADVDVEGFAERWRLLSGADAQRAAALNYEFTLFLLRNPDARDRVAAQRRETVRSLAEYIAKGIARLGGSLKIPAESLARVLLATNDGVTLASHLDGEDLYRTFLQLVLSSVGPPED
ncbi:TetR family transcriptional regulator [Mycobacterium adipatum]|jgi:AcrR family transcriptional regulator|uniref:TetR family transcriptional regulator n=1 Tax=Mycobacterium adipatum TaxID=1682113 RepID=A0A172UN33_9MYCO|nr:TetR/AcrR family transcriptional regulator [Mycobacterium adipatum]ANE80423.1 TetR family transcriptional regulator [Mycobacterium adipatum]MBI5736146.1 TetR/AcrR family transcriptional regulator [Mycolicibacterium neoaurum]